jgi:anhydro-N-acetylmuramic acid kinase
LRAKDIGPGNVLIDEYLKKTKKLEFDLDGNIASQGKVNMDIINQFIEHEIYNSKNRHSYDRSEFDFNFVKGLEFEDAVSTLNYFTALIISNFLNENFDENTNIILCGGGRKNKTLSKNIKNLTKKNVVDIDEFNFDGDFIESQAFAYLAIRSFFKKNISYPKTTKVKKPITGGEVFENF